MAHLHDRTLRDLLLPRCRGAPGTHRQLRGERVRPDQRRPDPRPRQPRPPRHLQDAQRVRAAEHHSGRGVRRGRRLRGTVPAAHRAAHRRAARPALPADRPRADAPVRVRHHPALGHPARHPAVGRRGARRLHGRRVAAPRPDDGPRRRPLGHPARDEQLPGLRPQREPPARLQPRARRVRVHRGPLGHGRRPRVPVLVAQVGDRRRERHLRRRLQHPRRGVRRRVLVLHPAPFPGLPRQGTARRLRPRPRPRPLRDPVSGRLLDRAVAVRRPPRRLRGQPQGPGDRHHPPVDRGRRGRVQPDRGLQPGSRLRVDSAARRAVERGAVDVVVAGRRPARVLRPQGEVPVADAAERGDPRDRGADRPGDGRRAGVAGLLAGRALRRLLGPAERGGRHPPPRPRDP